MMRNNSDIINLVKKSDLFDADWYLATYPDVLSSGLDAIEHYLKFGSLLQRDPSPKFSAKKYLAAHADLKEKDINPLVHYLSYGKDQGREIFSSSKRKAPEPKLVKPAPNPISSKLSGSKLGNVAHTTPVSQQELKEENELLQLQLLQIQEELELLYLENQSLAAK